MAYAEKDIFVYENWHGDTPSLVGVLRVSANKGRETFSFEYAPEWLDSFDGKFSLDPDLSFVHGRQYKPQNKNLLGLFSDSCPDRWGKLLMNRKEDIDARKENRKPRKLLASDYLLGVHDESRMGALRFSLEKGGEFLCNYVAHSIPPWIRIRDLEHASVAFDNDDAAMGEKWLKELLAPGSSLGGSRPKATVLGSDGSLWIAKFPSKHDEWNIGAWEKTVHDLARSCSLNVPESKLETYSDVGGTFLVKRFDRDGKRRVHFAFAMTLLGQTDGASGAEGMSYIDLADFIRAYGARPQQDLLELWKRIVFSMAVSNTDDHLRNHGFILSAEGWRLSPLYDVNPVPGGKWLSLNVIEAVSSIDLSLAIEVSEYFGLNESEAEHVSSEICKTVQKNWVRTAESYGLSRSSIEHMRPAFTLEKNFQRYF
jgi:serine/threonine-protein kinase HipA